MNLPRVLSMLRNATLADGRVVDVTLEGATVMAVEPASGSPASPPTPHEREHEHDYERDHELDHELDLTGFVLLPAGADPHSHLDKSGSWDAIRPPMGDLMLAIDSWQLYTETMTEADVANRARAQALAMLANGTTAIRSHVDILRGDDPLLCARALIDVRDELSELMDIELVVLAGPDIPDVQIDAALDLGFDLVGGAPHLGDDHLADLRRLLAIAERRGTGVDLHTDESLDGPVTLLEFARIVRGWTQNVSAGHCVRLGTLDDADRADVIAAAIDSRIGIIANPITNLYLQGWEDEHSMRRGLTAARELIDAGARFAAGADNVRDPFNPLGRSDVLETAMLLVTAGHLTIDEAYAAVSSGAREVMGLPVAGAIVGGAAEFVAVRGTCLADVVARASAERHVIHAGRLVASTTVTTSIAAPRERGRATSASSVIGAGGRP